MSFDSRPRLLESPPYAYLLERYPELNDHYLVTGATESGTVNLAMKLHAVDRGEDRASLFLTPAVLRDWLLLFPASTRKVVVLQGCYSGGFLQRDPDYQSSSTVTLADVPNVVAVAAARHDRSSFGCDTGSDRTVFGRLWIGLLKRRLSPDGEIDWEALFSETKVAVDRMEAKNIAISTRSRPVILVTHAAR